MKIKSLLVLVCSGFATLQTSFAGEVLRLREGDIQIKAMSSFAKSQTFKTFGSSTSLINQVSSKYFIIQFIKEITPNDELAIRESGLEVLRYVPDDAYIVRGDHEQIQSLKNTNPNFKDHVVYLPQIRLSPELKVRSVFNGDVLQTVAIQLFKGVNAERVAEDLQKQGVIILSISDSVIVARALTKKIEQVAAQDGVEWVAKKAQMQLRNFVISNLDEPTESLPTLNSLTGYETGAKIMGFEAAWAAGYKGQGQIVAIADTGLDTGNKATLAKDFSHLKDSYYLGLASTTWADYVGHGSHVAGSVGGSGEQSGKIILGGANEAEIVAQSLWSEQYKSLTTPDNLGVIFDQAYKTGARIHSNSWGDPESHGLYGAESMQVDQFIWDHPDMLILFASGNDGIDADRDGRIDPGAVSSPSTSKNIISVGASENLVKSGGVQRKLGEIGVAPEEKPWPVDPIASDTISDNPKGIVAFSSRGPTQDGRLKPDLVAPGSNILSNCSKMPGSEELWGRFDENYCWSGGTSMSTPLVAGAAVLVRERIVKIPKFESPSAALIKAVLLHTAEDLYPGQFGEVGQEKGQELLNPGPNFDQGYGRVDIARATRARLNLVDSKVGIATGETRFYYSFKPITKITLVYSDAPGAISAAKALVNNLDLVVRVGDQVFESLSTVDNTEQIILPEPTEAVSIFVRGKNVPMGKDGKQPFALVYSE